MAVQYNCDKCGSRIQHVGDAYEVEVQMPIKGWTDRRLDLSLLFCTDSCLRDYFSNFNKFPKASGS